jgi:hypothetical protein
MNQLLQVGHGFCSCPWPLVSSVTSSTSSSIMQVSKCKLVWLFWAVCRSWRRLQRRWRPYSDGWPAAGTTRGAARELEAALEAEAVDHCRAAAHEMAGQLGGGCPCAVHLLHFTPYMSCLLLLRQLVTAFPAMSSLLHVLFLVYPALV